MTATALRDGHDLPSPPALLHHLDHVLDARVTSVDELDTGVLRIGRASGVDWVMRVFPRQRPLAAADGDSAILRGLAELGFPAERPIGRLSVSQVAGHPVLVTEYVEPVPRGQRRDAIRAAGGLRRLGELLGQLSGLEPLGSGMRPGGAWHHLVEGHPSAELDAARSIIDGVATTASGATLAHLDRVRAALDTADDGTGLPDGFVHPDFVLANVVATPGPGMVIVDWAGAGRGPRAWPLAFLLWAETMKDARRADLVLAGYLRHVSLEAAELARLSGLVRARPLTFVALRLRDGGIETSEAAALADAAMEQSEAVAARARRVIERLAG